MSPGTPNIFPALRYREANAAIAWLGRAEGNAWSFGTYDPYAEQ